MSKLVKVAITGAAGDVGYALLFRLASGDVFGHDTKIALHLMEIPPVLPMLKGVAMELDDCTFPLLDNIVITDDPEVAFDGINWALLIGAKPRSKGMLRGDLIRENAPIFVAQGRALSKASDDVRIAVVGNPANTNALIASRNAQDIPSSRFTAMTFLDMNRAYSQLAKKASVNFEEISRITIWGNHSATQYPDAEHGTINGKPLTDVITDIEWLRGEFITSVRKRGTEIIQARGLSSSASAANALINHVQCFEAKTPDGEWFSAAISSDGSYGIDEGLIFSFPIVSDGKMGYSIVQGLELNDFANEKINITLEELKKEKSIVEDLL
ncbi:MAG: malate dehydrogenase [Anaerolineaceae bacterium 4572_78]|nr:MAG: malate dehydrogenase [Anaerolineaceae bacterium 4572_78]